jgi:DNA (cytosine-5)-methyltransferase 1
LELGLEWAGLGPTAWQVEIDPFCRRMLKKNFPHAQIFEDIKKCSARNLCRVNLICFGFPCQDLSSAGTQAGLGGDRSGLFYECARIVKELRPEWIVVENVASGAHLWVDSCCAELERLGYACLPIPIAARDVGALHRRARVFIVAHLDRGIEHAEPGLTEVASAPPTCGAARAADADAIGCEAGPDCIPGKYSRGVAVAQGHNRRDPGFPGWGPEPGVVRMADGIPEGLDLARLGAQRLAAIRQENDLASERERALGNSVVPQCAEVVGWIIQELIQAARFIEHASDCNNTEEKKADGNSRNRGRRQDPSNAAG